MSGYLIATDKKSAFPQHGRETFPESVDAVKVLDQLAKRLGVAPLSSFVSLDEADQEMVLELMAEADVDTSGETIEPPKWFDPADGIKTVQALLVHLSEEKKAIKNGPDMLAELTELSAALETIAEKNGRWRLYYDY